MSRRVLFLLALPLHFWASSANTADDPVDALTGGGASTFPCDVMCCGFGHRFAVVWEGYDMARDLNKTLAVGWGPCRSNVSNIFGKMFTPTPYVHPSLDSFPKWQKDGCTAHGATGANPYKFPKRGLELFDTLARNVDPAMQERVHKFKAEVNWASTPVIGIYVRAGNQKSSTGINFDRDFHSKGRGLGMNPTEFLQRHMKQLARLAEHLGYADNYRIFLATDTQAMQETFMRVAGPARGIIRPQSYLQAGHPMLWGHLGHNNKGAMCDLDWFTNPLLDNLLLADAAVLVLTKPSTFPRFSASVQYARGRLVCETWPVKFAFHTAKLTTSHDYHCYKFTDNGCSADDCRDADTPKLAHTILFEEENGTKIPNTGDQFTFPLPLSSPPETVPAAPQPTPAASSNPHFHINPKLSSAPFPPLRCPLLYTPLGKWMREPDGDNVTYHGAQWESSLGGLTCSSPCTCKDGAEGICCDTGNMEVASSRSIRCVRTGGGADKAGTAVGLAGFLARTTQTGGAPRIYLRGDSTSRQIFQAITEFFGGSKTRKSNDEFKEMVRGGGVPAVPLAANPSVLLTCAKQTHRATYQPNPAFGSANCFNNELTCTYAWTSTPGGVISGSTSLEAVGGAPPHPRVGVTWDWKHFPLEDRERFVLIYPTSVSPQSIPAIRAHWA